MKIFLRNYRDTNDLVEMLKIRESCVEADLIDTHSLLEGIPTREQFEKDILENHCVPESDIILAFSGEKCIGYSRIGWWKETDGPWLYLQLGNISPKWRTKGVRESLLQWSENRIRTISKQHDVQGNAFFGANATSLENDETQFLLKNGYKKVFSLCEMSLSNFNLVKANPIPSPFEIRKIDSSHLRAIWEANNAVYTGRQFCSVPSEEDYQEFATHTANDFDLWDVAWYKNQVAGFVLSRIEKGRAEVFEVGVIKQFRRKGLAHALLSNNVLRLKEKNITIVRLYTSGENVAGAKSLYEKVGFTHLKDFNRYRKAL